MSIENNINHKKPSLLGRRFGRMLILEDYLLVGAKDACFCVCNCGSFALVKRANLYRVTATETSCGCAYRETKLGKPIAVKHGLSARTSPHPLYKLWTSMKQRCENPRSHAFGDYGGRGIKVCDEWSKDFTAFVRDMGPRPVGFQVDRKDTNGPYAKDNCRWLSHSDQQKNKRDNVKVTMNDETLILADWCRRLEVNFSTVWRRINKQGMDPADALRLSVKAKKLTPADAALIREAVGTQAEIAKKFGVDPSTISMIKAGKMYSESNVNGVQIG